MSLPAPLSHDFFARDTLCVARELIGCTLHVGRCTGRIIETEAYTTDAASHAVTRPQQAAIMRSTHGHVYVYLIYGMHHCLNFTTDTAGPGAVLIRSLEPLRGLRAMQRRRAALRTPGKALSLCQGPGRLCAALGIDRSFDGEPLGRRIRVFPRCDQPQVACSERIGISADTALPWRFFEAGNSLISGPTRLNHRAKPLVHHVPLAS